MSQSRRLSGPQPRDVPQPDGPFRFAGDIGEPLTVTGTITRKQKVLGHRYSTVSTLLEINCGTSIVTIFSTAHWADNAQVGEQITVAGTVKKHQRWRGTPQTLLGLTTRIDTTDDSRTDPVGDGAFDVAAGWPTGKVTIRRRFPDDQNMAAASIIPTTATEDRSRQ